MKIDYKYFFLSVLFILYVVTNILITISLQKNILLTTTQKVLNGIVIWIIPFLLYFMIKDLINQKFEVMTKKQRDKLQKYQGRPDFTGGSSVA